MPKLAQRSVPRIAVIADLLEEGWHSMDLAAEQLATHLALRDDVESVLVRPPLRFARVGAAPSAARRALGRFAQLPIELATTRYKADFFHIADHSYGHLALLFPSDRVGIYCHDIDAYRALLPGACASRPRRLLSSLLLRGLRHAGVVFYSTSVVREEILHYGLLPASRLVQAPLGIAAEFLAMSPALEHVRKPPYLLHVGSCTPRKNIELLLQVFAKAREHVSDLELVQIGGPFNAAQSAYLEQRQLTPHVRQRRGVSRDELASLYAASTAVLLPSLAEGFGIPVIEALLVVRPSSPATSPCCERSVSKACGFAR